MGLFKTKVNKVQLKPKEKVEKAPEDEPDFIMQEDDILEEEFDGSISDIEYDKNNQSSSDKKEENSIYSDILEVIGKYDYAPEHLIGVLEVLKNSIINPVDGEENVSG